MNQILQTIQPIEPIQSQIVQVDSIKPVSSVRSIKKIRPMMTFREFCEMKGLRPTSAPNSRKDDLPSLKRANPASDLALFLIRKHRSGTH